MTYLGSLTFVHTAVSLVAITFGLPAILSLFVRGQFHAWRRPFLATAILTTASGFLFPFIGPTPAFLVGIVASFVLVLVVVASGGSSLGRFGSRVYAGGMVASLYLLVFVLIAQAFQKIPALNQFAPTGTEPAFAIAQIVALLAFVGVGLSALRAAAPSPDLASRG